MIHNDEKREIGVSVVNCTQISYIIFVITHILPIVDTVASCHKAMMRHTKWLLLRAGH